MKQSEKRRALENLVDSSVSRRAFAQKVLATGVASAGLGMFANTAAWAQSGISDTDILNFALNLEYLEAEFYTVATTGRRIADLGIGIDGAGRRGPTVGGAAVSLGERVRVVAEMVALDEQQHVRFLRAALGPAAVAKPSINLEALGLGFRSEAEFITLGRAFEDVGVSAYGGAAPSIQSPSILSAAARIALTEAQHAGIFRYFVYERGLVVPAVDGIDERPLSRVGDGRMFLVDENGLSKTRRPDQVLAVVYAAQDAQSGGFFPDGVNGQINAS